LQSSKHSKSRSKSSNSSAGSKASALRKTFTTLLAEGDSNLDITNSDEELETTHCTWLDNSSKVQMAFNTADNHGIDMRNVILLDNQSTVDHFCNPDLVQNIARAKSSVQVKSTGWKL
jgi:hypothetical protein